MKEIKKVYNTNNNTFQKAGQPNRNGPVFKLLLWMGTALGAFLYLIVLSFFLLEPLNITFLTDLGIFIFFSSIITIPMMIIGFLCSAKLMANNSKVTIGVLGKTLLLWIVPGCILFYISVIFVFFLSN